MQPNARVTTFPVVWELKPKTTHCVNAQSAHTTFRTNIHYKFLTFGKIIGMHEIHQNPVALCYFRAICELLLPMYHTARNSDRILDCWRSKCPFGWKSLCHHRLRLTTRCDASDLSLRLPDTSAASKRVKSYVCSGTASICENPQKVEPQRFYELPILCTLIDEFMFVHPSSCDIRSRVQLVASLLSSRTITRFTDCERNLNDPSLPVLLLVQMVKSDIPRF